MVGVEPLHEEPWRPVGPPRVKDDLHAERIGEPAERRVDWASPHAAFGAGDRLKPRRNEVGSEPFQRGDVEGFLFHSSIRTWWPRCAEALRRSHLPHRLRLP